MSPTPGQVLASFLGAPPTAHDVDALDAAYARALAAARAELPDVSLDDATFVRHLAPRLEGADDLAGALDALRVTDLFVACACLAGDRHALAAFEERCLRPADAALRKRGISDDAAEEAKQNVRERLLVGGGAPKLAEYDGRGDLRQWVRITVVREAIHLSKKQKKDEPLSFDLFALPADVDGPEVAYFKSHYRAEYKEAFEAALLKLPARARSLLRQQYILGMSAEQIGAIHQIHRATAARRVQSAREALYAQARLELAQRLGLSRAEIEEIVRLIESQLNVSLRRILASSD